MKTKEELAEECIDENNIDEWADYWASNGMVRTLRKTFLAGYEAGQSNWIRVEERFQEINEDEE